jgi:hypothetical protein
VSASFSRIESAPSTTRAVRASRAALVFSALLSGCPEPAATCDVVGAGVEAAVSEDRRLIGEADPYPADGMLEARWEELRVSQRARRAMAWEVIARTFAPVALAETTGVTGTVPRFRTWYDTADLTRIFRHAYEGLGTDGRSARRRFTETELDAAFGWSTGAILEVPGWTLDRFDAYALGIDEEMELAGVGGLTRIAMSPDATRHLMRSYPDILRCFADGSPPAFVDGAPETTQRLAREAITLAACETRTVGPYFVATGGRIEATFTASAGSGPGTMRLLSGTSAGAGTEVCRSAGEGPCQANGPGPFVVELTSETTLIGMLDVTHSAPDVAPVGCLDGAFPIGAATVAAEWRRADFDPLPTFDTSADAIAGHITSSGATWTPAGEAMPTPDQIYTMRVPAGSTFWLAGLHIRTRELRYWVNITLWWSPTPDETFGADRSASVEALGPPWNQYAMCVTVEDVERDPDPTGGAADPGLAAALEAVNESVLGSSWCSNPYIDGAPGLVRSNCVGCHQHAFTGVRPGETVMDEVLYPDHGRTFVRNNFPGDGFWGIDGGDDVAAMMQETIDYWAGL